MDLKTFWATWTEEQSIDIQKLMSIRHYKRGEFIYKAGDETQGLYIVKKGLVGLVIIAQSSGKEHLLRFFKKDQFFGHRSLLSNEVYHGFTVALEPTEVQFISKHSLLSFLDKHPLLYKDIATTLAKELRRCENQHVMILENELLSRVALSLIYLKDLTPEHNWTRQEIANFCGSTVSTVIKTLAEIERLGHIEQSGRTINITNRQALLDLAY